jgi:hypothetical protein
MKKLEKEIVVLVCKMEK